MAIVAPFRGTLYNYKQFNDMGKLMAPPYDVISEEEQAVLYEADPHNVIRLILGKKKTGDSDWDNRYTRSAEYFSRWQSSDVLTRVGDPCMYLTSQAYDPGDGGGERERLGLITLVRIEDEGSGVILPHEQTFSAHRDDRLRLMRACKAQFSQIFGLYEDPENRVLHSALNRTTSTPEIAFNFRDGTRHQMWVIQDRSVFRAISEAMSDKNIFIADGHHRYETTRNYRNMMRTRHSRKPSKRSYEYVMMYLTNMNDPGLTILPSHRLIKQCETFQLQGFLDRLEQWFDISRISRSPSGISEDCVKLGLMLEEWGHSAPTFIFHCHSNNQYYCLSLKASAGDRMMDEFHPALKGLDVLILSRIIFQDALGFSKEDLDDEKMFYYDSRMDGAISKVDSGMFQMAFLINPTQINQVKEVARQGLIMPRKSTYFYPKVISGLVFNQIDPNERIQTP